MKETDIVEPEILEQIAAMEARARNSSSLTASQAKNSKRDELVQLIAAKRANLSRVQADERTAEELQIAQFEAELERLERSQSAPTVPSLGTALVARIDAMASPGPTGVSAAPRSISDRKSEASSASAEPGPGSQDTRDGALWEAAREVEMGKATVEQIAQNVEGWGDKVVWKPYADIIRKHKIDGETVLVMENKDLISFGFSPLHARVFMKKLLSGDATNHLKIV